MLVIQFKILIMNNLCGNKRCVFLFGYRTASRDFKSHVNLLLLKNFKIINMELVNDLILLGRLRWGFT